MKRLVIAAILALVMPVAAMASELDDAIGKGAVRLSGADLTALYAGHTWEGKTAKGAAFSPQFNADGSGALTFKGETGQGGWRVDGDKGCTHWAKLRGGKEACFAIVKLPDGSYAAYDETGALNSTFSVK